MQNTFFGHLHLASELFQVFPRKVHVQVWGDYIRTKYNLPEVFYVDWRPVGPLWLFIADPEISSDFVTTTQSLPKSPMETEYVVRLLGARNLVSLEGRSWKTLRSMFNPGFSSSNIMAMTGYMIDSILEFREAIGEKARNNEHLLFEEYTTRSTIDIIGRATMNIDVRAQHTLHPIIKHFRERVKLMPAADAVFPWQDLKPLRPFQLWRNSKKLDQAISVQLDKTIRGRFMDSNQIKDGDPAGQGFKSVIDLALNAVERESEALQRLSMLTDLPSNVRHDLIDQIKTFFFAGHDSMYLYK